MMGRDQAFTLYIAHGLMTYGLLPLAERPRVQKLLQRIDQDALLKSCFPPFEVAGVDEVKRVYYSGHGDLLDCFIDIITEEVLTDEEASELLGHPFLITLQVLWTYDEAFPLLDRSTSKLDLLTLYTRVTHEAKSEDLPGESA